MGGLILAFSIVIWALGYFQSPFAQSESDSAQYSCLEHLGRTVSPVFAPMGFDWEMSVGLLSGLGAKELVVSTLGVLYATTDQEGTPQSLPEVLSATISPEVALAYMVFILLYIPCIATIVAIKSESGSVKWALFSVVYSTFFAYLLSWCSYQVCRLVI
jgi:ferrous iron transport protein B